MNSFLMSEGLDTKMRNRRWIRSVAAITLICVMLALSVPTFSGCNQKPTVTLSLWGAVDDEELLSKIVESFKNEYGNQAEFEITICRESELTCKDTVLFCPEKAGDVFAFAGDQFYDLVKAGALLKIDNNVDKIIEDNGGVDSAVVDAVSYEGDVYAYPMTASNGYFLFYNSDYLSEEDVRSLDTILDKAEEAGKYFVMDFTSGWYTYSFFKAAGLDVTMNDDGVTNRCDWNSTSGDITGAEVLQSMLDIAAHPAFKSIDSNSYVEGVKSGSVIAGVSGTWNATAVEEAYGDGYEATILPKYTVGGREIQMHSVSGYKMIGVSAYTDESYWSQKLAEWITNEENQLLRFEMRAEGPSNVNAVKNNKVQESKAIAALSSQSEFAHIQLVTDKYWSESYKLGTVVLSHNLENKPLQEILDNFVSTIGDVQ
ncbi:MAG: extracellular solute-binding protein [Lachnospira sp.]